MSKSEIDDLHLSLFKYTEWNIKISPQWPGEKNVKIQKNTSSLFVRKTTVVNCSILPRLPEFVQFL